MKVLILHLSDIHLKETDNSVEGKFGAIAPAVQNEERDLNAVLLVVSGDLVNSGSTAEFSVAERLLANLRANLAQRLNVATVRIAVVPGNHDCHLPESDSVRNAVIEKIRSSKLGEVDGPMMEFCAGAQKNFFDSRDKPLDAKPDFDGGKMYWEYHLTVGEFVVLIRCYNTAWQSTREEAQGSLHFPGNALPGSSPSVKGDYVVSVFHHPYNWMPTQTYRSFRDHIERASDLILTGHEHEPDHFQKYSFGGAFRRLPAHLRKSLTYDNGREMAEHLAFSIATDVAVYFCDPHSPWQRGGVENINGLIREYFPKGTDFASVTKRKIARAEWCLNNRPRVVLDGQTPSEVFHDAINKSCALCA